MLGYKQTEVGVIPDKWDVKPLGELFSFRNGVNADKNSYGRGIRFINVLEPITYSHLYGPEITGRVSLPESVAASFTVRRGDVLFNRTSETQEEVGMAATFLGEERVMFGGFVIRGRPLSINLDPTYSGYALRAPFIRSQIIPLGQGAIRANIGQQNLSLVLVPVPPIFEQRAIATALNDVDALLGGLDRLIAKKRDLKQATMQQLLTGQTRLTGFHAEWMVRRLGDIGEISSAGVDKKVLPDEVRVRLVNYLDVYRRDFIYSKDLTHWVTAPPQQAMRCAVQKGDIFFTPTSETRDDIGISTVAMEDIPDAAYSYHVTRLRLYEHWDLRFRTYAFKTRAFLDQAQTLCDGNGTRYVISQGKFRSMKVKVPPFLEQSAIGEVLTAMDAELTALEERRIKTHALKQAMMQELLTGRTRLLSLVAETKTGVKRRATMPNLNPKCFSIRPWLAAQMCGAVSRTRRGGRTSG